MSLKAGLRYCKYRDRVIAYEDSGIGRDSSITSATSALVFMVRGLFSHWKHSLGYQFACHKLQTGTIKKSLEMYVSRLQAIGLHVRVLISDQGSVFFQSCMLNVVFHMTYYIR